MKRIAVILILCLSASGLVLLGTYIYFQNNVDLTDGQTQDSREFERHYLFISSDESSMWQDVFDAAYAAAEDSGAYLEWCGRETSSHYSDADAIEIGIAEGVDGILLYENSSGSLEDAIGEAAEVHIPVVTLLRDVDDSDRISYIGFSNYEKGRLYGEQLIGLLHAGINRVCLVTDSGDSESELNLLYSQMTQIVKEKAPEGDTISVSNVMTDSTDFDAEETIRNLLVEDSIPDILICENAVQTGCAIQTLIDYNLVDQVQVIGYYTADMTLSAIRRELIPAAVTIDTDALGRNAVDALNEYLDTGYVSDYYNIGLQTVTKKNVYLYTRGNSRPDGDGSGGES